MIRVSVVSKNDIGKYIIKCCLFVLALFLIMHVYKNSSIYFTNKEISTKQGISYLEEEITAMGENKPNNYVQIDSNEIISSELRMSMAVSSRNNKIVEKQLDEGSVQDESKTVSNDTVDMYDVSEDVSTEIVPSAYKDNYNCEIESVKIKNETSYNLESCGISSDIMLNNKNVLIYHTHTCECYTPTEQNQYEPSGNFRTTDLNYSVAKVGDIFGEYLTSFGFNVIHDKTFHDYPTYSGSYGRSLTTVSNLLQDNKNIDVLFDIHRDAIADESYAPKVKIGDEYAARIMFVIGTDGSGLDHPNWKNNLSYAIKVQKKADEMYPGLFKPIIVRNSRYNQNLGNCATIIEVGSTGNTLEECEVSVKYLAKVLEKIVS